MKCKDCEMEVTKVNDKGQCKKCEAREYQKTHKGLKYEKLKDIKGTPEYNFVMSKRLGTDSKFRKDVFSAYITQSKENTNFSKIEIFEKVENDINENLAKHNLSTDFFDYDVGVFLNSLVNFISEKDYLEKAHKIEVVYNELSSDYLHLAEKSEWGSEEERKYLAYEKALLELRRPIKNKITQLKDIEELINAIHENKDIMNIINKLKDNYDDIIDNNKDYKLRRTNLGETILEKKYKDYNAEVIMYNLYGNPGGQVFKNNRPIYAEDEDDAKEIFKRFLNDKFETAYYKEKDIKITEV